MARRFWPLAWPAWIAVVLVSFGVLEERAYRRNTHPTLSRFLARWMGVQPRRPWGRFGPLAFAAGWIALTVHVSRLRADQP